MQRLLHVCHQTGCDAPVPHDDGNGKQTIFYMDIRSHGKEYEPYYEKARQTGVSFVRSPPHTLSKSPEGHGVTMVWVDEAGTNHDSFFVLVILSVGLSNPETR